MKGHPLHVLILECNASKLASQDLSFGRGVAEAMALVQREKNHLRIEVLLIDSYEDFSDGIVDLIDEYSSVYNILVIGHSDSQSLTVAPNFDISWSEVGKWFQPLKPKTLAFVACEAGQFVSTQAIFDELETCRNIYASPFKSTKQQFEALKILFAYLLLTKRVDTNLIWVGQIMNFIRTGGVILDCTRRNPEGNQLFQFLGSLSS